MNINFNNFQQNNNNNNYNNNNIFNIEKIKILFKSNKGGVITLSLGKKTTVDEMLKEYLIRIGKPELINAYDEVVFIYNQVKIRFDSTTTIEEYFQGKDNIIVLVNYTNNIMGG